MATSTSRLVSSCSASPCPSPRSFSFSLLLSQYAHISVLCYEFFNCVLFWRICIVVASVYAFPTEMLFARFVYVLLHTCMRVYSSYWGIFYFIYAGDLWIIDSAESWGCAVDFFCSWACENWACNRFWSNYLIKRKSAWVFVMEMLWEGKERPRLTWNGRMWCYKGEKC